MHFHESSEAAVALMCSTNVSDTNVGMQLRVKCVTVKEASAKHLQLFIPL